MSYRANVYQVMTASPSDVPRERQMAREIVFEWNAINSRDKKIVLFPVGWEYNSTPEMGDRGQEFINKQILHESDLLIGIFWTRIGSPTGQSISGTVEEIEKHIGEGKPTMLYFSNLPVELDSVDKDQFNQLTEFKKKCQSNGLIETYSTLEEFRNKLIRQLSLKIIQNDYFKSEDTSENDEVFEENDNEKNLVEKLSEVEKTLLIETSLDPYGTILKAAYKGGFDITTNRKRLNTDFEPRTRAMWEEAFNNLLYYDMIEERGMKGEVFALTMLGYKIADMLKER